MAQPTEYSRPTSNIDGNTGDKGDKGVVPVAPDEMVDRPGFENGTDGGMPASEAQPHVLWRVAGLGGAVWLVVRAVEAGSGVGLGGVVDPPSAAIVVGCTVGLLLCIHGLAGSLKALGAVFRRADSDRAVDDAISFWRMGAGFALGTGFLGTLIGMIIMLQCMSDPSRIGLGLAICLISQLYGVALAILFCVAAGVIARRASCLGQLRRLAANSVVIGAMVCGVGTLTVLLGMAVIVISMSGPIAG